MAEETQIAETPVVEEVAVEAPVEETPIDSSLIEAGQMPSEKAVPTEEVEEAPAEEALTEEVATEEVSTEEVAPDEAATEEIAEPFVIDTEAELPVVLEKVNEVLDKYELPEDVQVAINALRAKAEFVPVAEVPEIVTELADYGDVDTVKVALDTANLLSSVTVNQDGSVRPNTDKFVQRVIESDPDTAAWLFHDIASTPSTDYQGLTKFEEAICNSLSVEGDTVGTVMARYQAMIARSRDEAFVPESDVPEYIPASLYKAFRSLPKESREELAVLVPTDPDEDYFAADRARKIIELQQIQKGIDAEEREAKVAQEAKQSQQLAYNNEIATTQEKFYNEMRNVFTENILKDVQFSPDPKMQALLAHQQVTTLTQAFDDGSAGEYARKALSEAGINFDYGKAQGLIKAVEDASVALTFAKRQTVDGKQVNQVEFNKATRQFEQATRAWQEFAVDIIQQEQKLTATGTQEAIKEVVAKQKIQPKARPVATQAKAQTIKEEKKMPAYKSDEWYDAYAESRMREIQEAEARKAAAYA